VLPFGKILGHSFFREGLPDWNKPERYSVGHLKGSIFHGG